MSDARRFRALGLMGAVAGVAAAVTALTVGAAGAVDLLAGIILGSLTMSGLRSLVSGLGPGPHGPRHTLLLGLHLLKYPLVLVVLYLVLVTLHRSALLVMGGYTLALIMFLVFVTRLATPAATTESET